MQLTCTLLHKSMPAHLANGHLGLQGSDSGVAPARSFMVGISDLTPNDHYRMAQLPTWNAVEVTLGEDTLSAAFAREEVRGYRQTLDMATASLRTEHAARIGGTWVSVMVETWLSRDDRFLACQRITLAAERPCTVQVTAGITQNPEPERYPFRSIIWPHEDYPRDYGQGFQDQRMRYIWHPGHMHVVRVEAKPAKAAWALAAAADGHGPAIGAAMALYAPQADIRDVSTDTSVIATCTLDLTTTPRVIEQYFAFSRDDRPGALAQTALARAKQARKRGYDALWDDHAAAWRELWQGDILVEGDETLARQARADLFMLYQNTPVDDRFPIQIMGIASPGYFGGCFWDTDVYNVPALLPFRAALTLGTARFRKRILPMAMKNAARAGCKGARFSLISELVEGEENCLAHSALAEGEIHFTADAALMCWMIFCATGDDIFLRLDAWPVIEAVADYFASRVTWVPWENRYELLHVHSAEEALGNVHNCLYTNAAVRKALRIACRTAELLGIAPDPLWGAVAERLHLPFNKKTGLYQANSGTELPCPNRWLEVNSILLADLPVTPEQLADIISVPPIGWDMSYQATIAAQAGDPAKMREYLDFQATNFIHPEYLLRTEMKENDAGPYLTGSACLIQNLLLGAGGLRWREDGLHPTYPACLPAGITRITFPRLEWHEQTYAVEINRERGTVIEPLSEGPGPVAAFAVARGSNSSKEVAMGTPD